MYTKRAMITATATAPTLIPAFAPRESEDKAIFCVDAGIEVDTEVDVEVDVDVGGKEVVWEIVEEDVVNEDDPIEEEDEILEEDKDFVCS